MIEELNGRLLNHQTNLWLYSIDHSGNLHWVKDPEEAINYGANAGKMGDLVQVLTIMQSRIYYEHLASL